MTRIRLPHNDWRPRPYQMALWKYLESGGKHAEAIHHRRAGKDEVCLHWTAVAAHQRVATYWHMLPMANQARRAIWEAVNPHTGKRRIDEAFPHELRETTRENEMMIKFKIGSTWQVLGSDNYNALVGSPPAGVVFSEWALCDPASAAYLSPIFAENDGWQLYITTPRGKNHAYRSFQSAQRDPSAFAEILSVDKTGAVPAHVLAKERQKYIDRFGVDAGEAFFNQEYYCDWDAAILGAFYGHEMRVALDKGRITSVDHDESLSVHTAWDLGWSDDTAIWFFQVHRGEVRLIDYHSVSGADVATIAQSLHDKPYRYGDHWLPHDARPKTLASGGRSIVEQLWAHGIKGRIVPSLSVQDGIQATRMMFDRCYFDAVACEAGIESLRQYHREYDTEKKMFKDKPAHDWSSHGADAFRMLGVAWRELKADQPKPAPRFFPQITADELFWPETASQKRDRL